MLCASTTLSQTAPIVRGRRVPVNLRGDVAQRRPINACSVCAEERGSELFDVLLFMAAHRSGRSLRDSSQSPTVPRRLHSSEVTAQPLRPASRLWRAGIVRTDSPPDAGLSSLASTLEGPAKQIPSECRVWPVGRLTCGQYTTVFASRHRHEGIWCPKSKKFVHGSADSRKLW